LERDNDLWLRGHIGTRNGKKGNAPLGPAYFLINWDFDQTIHEGSFLKLKWGPFLDVGRVCDASGNFDSKKWLWDPGVQFKVRVLASLTAVFSYGKDLRTGRNAFYATVSR
jgi:hypothetical protein